MPRINIEPGAIEFRANNSINRAGVLIESVGQSPLRMGEFRLENLSGAGTLEGTISVDGNQLNLVQGADPLTTPIELPVQASMQLVVTYDGNFIAIRTRTDHISNE